MGWRGWGSLCGGIRVACALSASLWAAMAACSGAARPGSANPDGAAVSPPAGGGGTSVVPNGGTGSVAVTDVKIGQPDAAGVIELRLTVQGARGPFDAAVAVSRGGLPFAPASVTGTSAPAGSAGLTVDWQPLDDIGFRPDATVVLRFVVTDELGAGPAKDFPVPAFANRHAAGRRVDHYLANYGDWSDNEVALARRYDLVIVHPGQGRLTRAQVASLQQGQDAADPRDDVLVLCYISVGEDLRTATL